MLRTLTATGEVFFGARLPLLTLTQDSAPAEPSACVLLQPAYEWMLTNPEKS